MKDSPNKFFEKLNYFLGTEGRTAFFSTLIVGLVSHFSIMVSDIPNHDGLASLYFDQNMLTSGRWALGTFCGISSYYSIPWLIGVLSLLYLSLTSVFLVKLLKMKNPLLIVLACAMFAAFPSLASNFAYVFTMDGYMMGVLLSILAVYLVECGRFGFLFGGLALSLSLGTYQAYVPIAILLCIYKLLSCFMAEKNFKKKITVTGKYAAMGVIGAALYYLVLKLLLLINHTSLNSYQGMSEVASADKKPLFDILKEMYIDFVTFSLKGRILFANGFALAAVLVLAFAFVMALIIRLAKEGLFKSLWAYVIAVITVLLIPLAANSVLLVSSDVTYHLLMRYQWVMFGIMALAFIDETVSMYKAGWTNVVLWGAFLASFVVAFSYVISDNIAYSNLEKKYEKTYAYCVRLADRIEQTEGYYQGIPIYMIGVVGDDNFPVTDITENVTDHMLGIGGDYLLYTPENYELFYKNYMGISFNFLRPSEANYYDSAEYVAMPSFPGQGSTKVIDGVLYVKTENMH